MHYGIVVDPDNHLETLRRCGGYYSCPKDRTGRRLGPLVGYAGKYPTPEGARQWVGDIYANFAKAEEYPRVLEYFASELTAKWVNKFGGGYKYSDFILCGAPIGGYSFSTMLGDKMGFRTIKAEKEVVALKTATEREKSKLVFARHAIEKGTNYIIVEDVCNNFSTTEQLIDLIASFGGNVVAILCFLNRSLDISESYFSKVAGRDIPVICLVRLPIPEYKQEDPAVAEDTKRGNVSWKPKDEWPRLMEAMKS